MSDGYVAALERIARFPVQYPDDPRGDEKMAVNSVHQNEIARAALEGRQTEWDCTPLPYDDQGREP